MKLTRIGYGEKKHITSFDIDTTSEPKAEMMYNEMSKKGWTGSWDEVDDIESISYHIDTNEISNFKRAYKEIKATL